MIVPLNLTNKVSTLKIKWGGGGGRHNLFAGHILSNLKTAFQYTLGINKYCSTPLIQDTSVQFSSVAQSCPTICNPMNHSMPGLPVHHQLLEFIQTRVYLVGDAIQPSHPLSSPSPPAPNPSQHQSLPMSQLFP